MSSYNDTVYKTLNYFCSKGDIDSLRILGEKLNFKPLAFYSLTVCSKNKEGAECFEYIMDNILKVNSILRECMEYACEVGNLDIINILKDKHGVEPNDECMRLAFEWGHIECVKYLMDNFVGFSRLSRYSLVCALKDGHKDCVDYVYSRGCIFPMTESEGEICYDEYDDEYKKYID